MLTTRRPPAGLDRVRSLSLVTPRTFNSVIHHRHRRTTYPILCMWGIPTIRKRSLPKH
jgi:hypothetical protein